MAMVDRSLNSGSASEETMASVRAITKVEFLAHHAGHEPTPLRLSLSSNALSSRAVDAQPALAEDRGQNRFGSLETSPARGRRIGQI